LVGKPEGRRPFGQPRHRWEDNSKVDLKVIVWEGMDWVHLAHDWDQWWVLVNVVPFGSMKCRYFLD
jgi:hypothetical protein